MNKRKIHEPYIAIGQFGAYRREDDGKLIIDLVPLGKGSVILTRILKDEGCVLRVCYDDETEG